MRYRDDQLLRTFAENLRQRRAAAGYSQETFALHVGLHRTYISHVERAAVNLSLGNAVRIADALDLTVMDLIAEPPTTDNQ